MAAREAFIDGQGALDAAKLVFVDESGVITGMNRLYGWAPSGATPMITRSTRGKRLNIVGAIAHDGPRRMMTYEGSMNEARFLAYISAHLGPSLKKGDVVVLDGFSVHKMKSVAVAIATYGASVLILPPYSPELNPIEHTWSTLKARLRSIGAGTWSELVRLTDEVWNGLPANFFPDWVRHCGYAPST
ncbi:MAG: transposase [Myxococcota bacterium]